MNETSLADSTRNYFLLKGVFNEKNEIDKFNLAKLILAFSILPAIMSLASYYGGVYILPNGGRGFYQHFGYHSFFVTTPLIIVSLVYLIRGFLLRFGNFIEEQSKGSGTDTAKQLWLEHKSSLSLDGPTRYIVIMFCIVGMLFSLANFIQTLNPLQTYGNDVFDSSQYIITYIPSKLYLFSLWGILYPIVIFVTLHISFSLFSVLREAREKKSIAIDLFATDNCGGMSRVGEINFQVMLIYVYFIAIIYFLMNTHNNNYWSLILSLFFATALLTVQSFLVVYHLHVLVSQKKSGALEGINKKLNDEIERISENFAFNASLLAARNHILLVNTFPYSGKISILLGVMRSAPVVLALLKLYQYHPLGLNALLK